MMTVFISLHVTACILLILIILIQSGRGGGFVEGFAGVESMFGTKTNSFLTRATTILAVLFFITCISLALLSARQSKSLMSSPQPQKPSSASAVQEKEKGKEEEKTAKSETPIDKYADIYIKRVVDGDTIELENGERVRLIGIDTPEMHESDKLYSDSKKTGQDVQTIKELGKRSYQFTKDLLEAKRVRLEFDVEKQDKYERLLAYVYLPDGTFANAEIVRQGFASLMTIPPNVKYADLLLKLFQEARENHCGLWQ